MPTIEVDFETFKAIVAKRTDESVTEGEVVRLAMGLRSSRSSPGDGTDESSAVWFSEGVAFKVGQKLQHRFRGGRLAFARITTEGVEFEGNVYAGLSPAAVAAAGHQANGWTFWEVRRPNGSWTKADNLRA